MSVETHSFMDGKVHVYRRDNSRFWQCSTYLGGRNHRVSTKEETLLLAKEYAKEWYMERYVESKRSRQVHRTNQPVQRYGETAPYSAPPKAKKQTGPTFKEAAEKFIGEYKFDGTII